MGSWARKGLTAALLVCACRREETASRAVRPAQSASPTPAPVASAPAERKAVDSTSEPAIRALLSRWLDAQNRADFGAYQALYAKEFLGIKRVGAQTFRFNRPRWLLDRQGMFSHSPKVTTREVAVIELGQTAVVRFEQTFESGTFRDVGQKQLTLVREGPGFAITREEMLTSFQTLPSGVPAFPEFAFVEDHEGRGFALLERSNLPPAQPEFVDFELALSPVMEEQALPENRRTLTGRELTLYGEKGELCRTKVRRLVLAARAVPHEGQRQIWSGKGEEPAPPKAVIARALFELASVAGQNLALELEPNAACKGALYARAADQPPPGTFERRTPSAAERASALAAFKALPLYAKNQKAFELEGNRGDWASFEGSKPEVSVFVGPGGNWLSVSAEAGHGCAEYRGEGFAFFRVEAGGKLELASDGGNASWFLPHAVVDVNGDGAPELLGLDYRLFQGSNGTFRPALDLSAPVFACGC
jgi:ketosteroid isomerase-like protein